MMNIKTVLINIKEEYLINVFTSVLFMYEIIDV